MKWIQRHLGRRGAALLFFCLLDLAIAWSLVDPKLTPLLRAAPSYSYIVRYTLWSHGPLWIWAAVWANVGLVCGAAAWRRGHDSVAFALAILLKLVWAGMFLAAWLTGQAHGAWLTATIWAGFAAFVGVIAGWPEPLERAPEPPQ